MNIKGLDYNTQRERLVLPEYGREVQKMVDYCMTLPTKAERQRCAESIVTTMERMIPNVRNSAEYKQKLWDQLALISDFKLDIDWPVDIDKARIMQQKPGHVDYPMSHIPVRHYGKLVFELLDRLKTMPAGRERDELTAQTANQMKRDLMRWGHGLCDEEKVADDLARFTDGVIQLDLSRFKFAKIDLRALNAANNNGGGKKKKKR